VSCNFYLLSYTGFMNLVIFFDFNFIFVKSETLKKKKKTFIWLRIEICLFFILGVYLQEMQLLFTCLTLEI